MPPWAVMFQAFLVVGWGRAATEKLISPAWWTGETLDGFLAEQRPQMLPFFRWFSDRLLADVTVTVSAVVIAAQFAVAFCLISNRLVRPALWSGVVLNVAFMFAGRVNPSVFYLLIQLALLLALGPRFSRPSAMRRAVACSMAAALVVPFARTVHPGHAHEDPALTFAFVALLAAVTVMSHGPVRQLSAPTGDAVAHLPDPRG